MLLSNKKIPAERDSTKDNSMAGCTLTRPKQNRNRIETKMKLTVHTHTHTQSRQNADICEKFQCSLLPTFSGRLQSCESITWRFKENGEEYVGTRMAAAGFTFFASRISKERGKNEEFLGQADTAWTKNINSKVSSVRHFPYLKSTSWAHCAENRLPVEKLATQHKHFELYRPATEFSRVAENTNKVQKCFINVAELLQICCETPSFCSVSLLRTGLPYPLCAFNTHPTP